MSRTGVRALLSVIAIPMTISQWTPIPIASKELPKLQIIGESSWELTTKQSAGGYAFLLKEPTGGNVGLRWEWKVSKFPAPTGKRDDYAVRVGVLLSDNESKLPVPEKFEKLLSEKKQSLSYIVFYDASEPDKGLNGCSISPQSARIANCFISVSAEKSKVLVSPIEDATLRFNLSASDRTKLKVVGVWVFGDSDDSESESKAFIEKIELSTTEVAENKKVK
ncbi:MAG: DUF3047 domain-containing protein [Bacteriovoracia bacterium]